MRFVNKFSTIAVLNACLFFNPQLAHAELIAEEKISSLVYINPLNNGLSATTLVWRMPQISQNAALALRSGMTAVLEASTPDLSAFEANTFRRVNGINLNISFEQSALLLTVSAPSDNFPKAIDHLETLLSGSEFNTDWYRRAVARRKPIVVSKNPRPEGIIAVLSNLVLLSQEGSERNLEDLEFSFGMPRHVIARSKLDEHKELVRKFVNRLPRAKSPSAEPKGKPAFTLPKGVIHFSDPSSSEMLIMLVKAQEFVNEDDQIATNLLFDYLGAHQGSEMFRIIRQELRAAYSPRSLFTIVGKNKAILSLNATVAADEWPAIHQQIRKIYLDLQSGTASSKALDTVHTRLFRKYDDQFLTDAVWGAQNYLREYPDGTSGEFHLPLFQALTKAKPVEIAQNPSQHLPNLDDFLVILIGGGSAPTEALKGQGYCSLEANEPIRTCLEKLQ